MKAPSCPKCSRAMDEGFILDNTHGGQTTSTWVEGPPQKSFWTGLKVSGKVRRQVVTFCCSRCGFLESYAEMEGEPA